MRGFEIIPAQHGGFLVTHGGDWRGDGGYRGPLFAGSLEDCLGFLREQLSAPTSTQTRVT